MNEIRVGVAGVGAIGRNHARVLSGLGVLAAIYDTNLGQAQAVAAEFGGTAVRSVEELMALTDAVTVAAPTIVHFTLGSQLLQGR